MRTLTWTVLAGLGVVLPVSARSQGNRPENLSKGGDGDALRVGPKQSSPAGLAHAFSAVSIGRGFRFNNPYRLETVLGQSAESLSLTANYLNLALGASFGDPHGIRHGAAGHFSMALEGVPQQVVGLSYLVLSPLGRDFMLLGRGGVPVVVNPDLGVGLELGFGGAYLITGGLGVMAELISSLFFGAATWDHDPTLFPVVSLQLGAYAEYEFLP